MKLDKKIISVCSVLALAACAGSNDGYTEKDVWEDNSTIYARADVTEKNEALCFNKARMNARDKISNFVVMKYSAKDAMKINNAIENYASDRTSETKSMFTGAQYYLKPWDKKTRVCGVELRVGKDNIEALLDDSDNNSDAQ